MTIFVAFSASLSALGYNNRMNLVDHNAEDIVLHLSKRELQVVVSLVQESLAISTGDNSDKKFIDQGLRKITRILQSLESSHQVH